MIDNTAIRDRNLQPPFMHTALIISREIKLPFADGKERRNRETLLFQCGTLFSRMVPDMK